MVEVRLLVVWTGITGCKLHTFATSIKMWVGLFLQSIYVFEDRQQIGKQRWVECGRCVRTIRSWVTESHFPSHSRNSCRTFDRAPPEKNTWQTCVIGLDCEESLIPAELQKWPSDFCSIGSDVMIWVCFGWYTGTDWHGAETWRGLNKVPSNTPEQRRSKIRSFNFSLGLWPILSII